MGGLARDGESHLEKVRPYLFGVCLPGGDGFHGPKLTPAKDPEPMLATKPEPMSTTEPKPAAIYIPVGLSVELDEEDWLIDWDCQFTPLSPPMNLFHP